MKNTFDKKFASVYTDKDGQHRVILPNGEDITGIITTMVVDEVGQDAYCTAHFFVNLVPTREEALKKYKDE